MIPEFVGRLPVIATLNELTRANGHILTEPRNALSAVQELLARGGALRFTDGALRRLPRMRSSVNPAPAGALHHGKYHVDIMYDCSSHRKSRSAL